PRTYRFNITHAFTPESNESIHYWWFNSRNFNLEDKEADAFLYEASDKAYKEDVDALEWILEAVTSDVEPQFDLNFAPDKPGLLMRQILLCMAATERQRASSNLSGPRERSATRANDAQSPGY
ncbi:hypothetical protein EN871_31190, partial [bacterium M00.F.Ca.ET.228.01.1.1]